MINSVVVIPALNPDERMVDYVKALSAQGFARIIVINDGSSEEYDKFFDAANEVENCIVLRHVVNRGKGCALKTAMKHYLDNMHGYDGIITADADGQHTLEDAVNIANLMSSMDDALILGSRDFDAEGIPPRSRFGNRMTSVVFKMAHGSYLRDTQTGLRGIPHKLVPVFVETRGERYEYEMNMLIECSRRSIKMVEEPIQTVYIDDNSSSHFHVIRDSFKIYKVILGDLMMYILSGLISFLVDQGIFNLLDLVLLPLIFSGVLQSTSLIWTYTAVGVARVFSSLLNYALNKRFAFHQTEKSPSFLVKYVVLVVMAATVSGLLVWMITSLTPLPKAIVKPVIDLIFVLINYTLQRSWVFKKTDSEEE